LPAQGNLHVLDALLPEALVFTDALLVAAAVERSSEDQQMYVTYSVTTVDSNEPSQVYIGLSQVYIGLHQMYSLDSAVDLEK
jgi:hypothetical protein